jgi:P-type conjugative transfer protein TrbG
MQKLLMLLILTIKCFADDMVPPLVDIDNPQSIINNDKRIKKYQNSLHLGYDVGSDAVIQSLKWQNGGDPKPVLKRDGVVKFPYGQYEPTITCKPLNLCDIELEMGETIQSVLIGDSVRWNDGDQGIPIVYSGTGSSTTPHLVLKPIEANIATNLMVTTSKRTYMMKLKSSNYGYVIRSGFYYPSTEIMNYSNQSLINKNNNLENNFDGKNNKSLVDLAKLNYKYEIIGADYDWKPVQVFDDGISVYIKLPDNISSKSLPGLCIINPIDKLQCELVNFKFNDHFYIINRLFDEATLMNGFDNKAQIITIRKKQSGFFARLFGW